MAKASKEFYELCYKQYEFEMSETNQLYQRVSFVLVLITLLGTIVFKLARTDLLCSFSNLSVVCYYVFTIFSIIALVASAVFAIYFACPRKSQYKNLATMNVWKDWLEKYNDYYKESPGVDSPDDALLYEITNRLAEAQAVNTPINEERKQQFYKCFLCVSVGFVLVALQSIFYLILKIQGI